MFVVQCICCFPWAESHHVLGYDGITWFACGWSWRYCFQVSDDRTLYKIFLTSNGASKCGSKNMLLRYWRWWRSIQIEEQFIMSRLTPTTSRNINVIVCSTISQIKNKTRDTWSNLQWSDNFKCNGWPRMSGNCLINNIKHLTCRKKSGVPWIREYIKSYSMWILMKV